MNKSIILALYFLIILQSCNTSVNKNEIEKSRMEIMEVEKAFNDRAQQEGIAKAFSEFAAEDGVILRNGNLIKGREAIKKWYEDNSISNQTLSWKPNFIDVSSSGDMAYTYGSFKLKSIDSTGTENVNTGFFHTVWKLQSDGTWKFVWD